MVRLERSAGILVCLAALVVTPLFAGTPPQPIPNSVKYRDAGAHPATGRSGSAAIQARALRGQTETDIEVTTGQFESDVAPLGKLDKVQVKLFDRNGDVIVTDNYRKGALNGATGSFTYDWPLRGTPVQVQANVSGIDPTRTDVVTVGTTVKLRPDLTVSALNAPAQAYLGSIVTIDATVREANGDLGARADCILKVDGVLADHADGIWVDAGDVVTCQFRKAFDTLGQKQLTVELTSVVPGDYNTTNNSKSATINIVPLSTPLWYTMDAEDTTYDVTSTGRYHEEFTSFAPDTYPSYVRDQSDVTTQHARSASYGANLQIEKAVEFPVALHSRLIVDGQTLLESDGTIDYNPNSFMGFSGDGYWNKCGDSWDGWHWFFVCHFHSEFDGVVRDLSTAYSGDTAGIVTYASQGTVTTRYSDGTTNVWTYNGSFDYTSGEFASPMPASLGNHVDIQASFTDALANHYEAAAGVDLFPFPTYTIDYGEYCYNYDYSVDGWGRFTGYQCLWGPLVVSGTSGWSNGLVQQ